MSSNQNPRQAGKRPRGAAGFTLIEIMIVVGIMGIILTMGVPIVYRAWNKAPMAKAVADIVEICSNARAQAIMQGRVVELEFSGGDGGFSIAGAAPAATAKAGEAGSASPVSVPVASGPMFAGRLPDSVAIEDVDLDRRRHDFMQDSSLSVRFYPNGTSDELSIILRSDRNERCEIALEVTTGLAEVNWNPTRLR